MMYPRHLYMRTKHSLCGSTNRDSIYARVWVTCPKCQRIILAAHPGADPARLFNHPVA